MVLPNRRSRSLALRFSIIEMDNARFMADIEKAYNLRNYAKGLQKKVKKVTEGLNYLSIRTNAKDERQIKKFGKDSLFTWQIDTIVGGNNPLEWEQRAF